MRSIAAIIFAVLALCVSSFNVATTPHVGTAPVTRVTSSPVACMDFEDNALDNPNVSAAFITYSFQHLRLTHLLTTRPSLASDSQRSGCATRA